MRGLLRRRVIRYLQKRAAWLRAVVIAFLLGLFHQQLFMHTLGSRMEPLLLRPYFELSAQHLFPEEVVIVTIDQQTYAHLGVSPLDSLPRKILADAIDRLAQCGVKKVILDLSFRDKRDPDGDRRLSQSLRRVPTSVMGSEELETFTDLNGAQGQRTLDMWPEPAFAKSSQIIAPEVLLDYDTVRRFSHIDELTPYAVPMANALSPIMSLAAVPERPDFIRFYGPPGTARSESFYRILEDPLNVLVPFFRDRIVLIGISSGLQPGIHVSDTFTTPVSNIPMFGVEIHATIVANLIKQDWIRRLPPNTELGILNIFAFLLFFVVCQLKPIPGLCVLILGAAFWCALGLWAFSHNYFVPGAVLFGLVVPTGFVTRLLFHHRLLQKAYSDIEQALGIRLHLNTTP